MKRDLVKATVALWCTLSAWFFYVFYIRYFAWRNCFNELGRCYNPDGSEEVYTTSGFVWVIPAMLFGLLGIASVLFLAFSRRKSI